MSKLFIYYSVSGNGDFVAKKLEERGFDLRKVESKLKLSKNIILCMLKGGFKSLVSAKPKLINFDIDISNYDEIYVGSPIWNARLAAPTNTVLDELDFSNKKLTFVLYSGSGSGKKALKKLNKKYPDAKVIFLKQPKNNEEEIKKVE